MGMLVADGEGRVKFLPPLENRPAHHYAGDMAQADPFHSLPQLFGGPEKQPDRTREAMRRCAHQMIRQLRRRGSDDNEPQPADLPRKPNLLNGGAVVDESVDGAA